MFTSYKDIMHTLYQCDRFSQVFEKILNRLEEDLQKDGISMHQDITTIMPYGDGTVGIVEATFYFEIAHHGNACCLSIRFRPLETRYKKENACMMHTIMQMLPDQAAECIINKANNFQIVVEYDENEACGIEYHTLVDRIRHQLNQGIKAAERLELVNEKDN